MLDEAAAASLLPPISHRPSHDIFIDARDEAEQPATGATPRPPASRAHAAVDGAYGLPTKAAFRHRSSYRV